MPVASTAGPETWIRMFPIPAASPAATSSTVDVERADRGPLDHRPAGALHPGLHLRQRHGGIARKRRSGGHEKSRDRGDGERANAHGGRQPRRYSNDSTPSTTEDAPSRSASRSSGATGEQGLEPDSWDQNPVSWPVRRLPTESSARRRYYDASGVRAHGRHHRRRRGNAHAFRAAQGPAPALRAPADPVARDRGPGGRRREGRRGRQPEAAAGGLAARGRRRRRAAGAQRDRRRGRRGRRAHRRRAPPWS